jgi:threonine dehydrogenase-like Zn-dependent dehydrogenase
VRALWLEDRALRLRDDVPLPAPSAGEALIRVTLAGVCNTDLELVRGYYAYTGVPGHEFVGIVERAPQAPEWVERRVVGEINAAGGTCPTCLAGRRRHCERRTVLGIVGRDGAFATHLRLPVENLYAAIDMAPFVVDEITLVGSRCGPFAPALASLARGAVDPRPLVEARYPLAEAVAAFEHAARPGALKVLVEC